MQIKLSSTDYILDFGLLHPDGMYTYPVSSMLYFPGLRPGTNSDWSNSRNYKHQHKYGILKVPDMIHHIIPPPNLFSNPLWFWYQKFSHIFLTFAVKFGVNIPNTLGEGINRNVAWKLENVVTTLNKTINIISRIFSYYF